MTSSQQNDDVISTNQRLGLAERIPVAAVDEHCGARRVDDERAIARELLPNKLVWNLGGGRKHK